MDCNDNDNTIYPDAPELCDGILNSCNGAMLPGEIDNDGDGYVECLVDPAEWKGIPAVVGGGDADDTDETVHPGAPELCDGILNNCDGTMLPTEVDSDGDGYVACTIDPAGWKGDITVIGGGDADDADADVYPEAPETCDGKDNDQNGMIDDDFSCSHLVTASDNFDSSEFNRLAWEIREEDDGVIGTSLSSGQLIMTQPPADHNQGDSVRTNCLFFGDFDVVVDFDLLDSDPVAAGLNLGIEARTYGSETMMDVARWRDGYLVHFLDGYHYAHRSDSSGKLKLSRRGNTMTGYYFDGHHFVEIGSGPGSADPVAFSLVLHTDPNSPYTQVVFDNFTVHSEDALCAQEPDGFRYDIEYFSITGNRPGYMIDEFDDGDLWEGVSGTVFESDGRLTLTDPGEIELESEDGHFIVIAFSENYTASDALRIQDGQGDFTAECMWLSPTIYKNTGFNLGAKLRDDSGTAQLEFYIIFSSIEEGESSCSGLPEGTQLSFIYENGPLDTEQVWSDPVDPADVHDVIFQLEFIDALNQFSAYCSLNGAAGPFRLIGSPVIVDISDINAVEWYLETSVFDRQTPCRDIFDADYDMDGKDIFLYLNDNKGITLSGFATQFGRTNCL